VKFIYTKLTYVKDFPLKTMGGATAAKIQNARWSCKAHREMIISKLCLKCEARHKCITAKQSIYQVKQEKPSKVQSTIGPAKIKMKQIPNQECNQIRMIKICKHILLEW